jgi:transcriptional regulator with XRE-family HTH domain
MRKMLTHVQAMCKSTLVYTMTKEFDLVPSLRGYSLPAALRMAFAMSGKSDDEIAAAMGWSSSTASRIFCNQDYWPSLPTLPKLCVVLGNGIVARWIVDNADYTVADIKPLDAASLFRHLRRMMRSTADLLEAGEAALTDGKVETGEARRILRELTEIFQTGAAMLAGLQAVILEDRK